MQHGPVEDERESFVVKGKRGKRPMEAAISRSVAGHELGRVKRAMVRDLREAMRRKHVSQASLARRISTSRSAVGRLLKEEDSSLTLRLLGRIAVALGARVNLRLAQKGRRSTVARKKP
jgi:DNA-binding Xre family transcriptional regulator